MSGKQTFPTPVEPPKASTVNPDWFRKDNYIVGKDADDAIVAVNSRTGEVQFGPGPDISVINNASLAVNSQGGGSIYVCATKTPYLITASSGPLLVYNNMLFEAGGWGTVFRVETGANVRAIINADWTNGNSHFIIRNLQIDGNGTNQTLSTTIGIELHLASYFIVEDCYVHDTHYDGVGCWHASHDGIFKNNVVHSTFHQSGIFIECEVAATASTYDIIIEGNIVYNCSYNGIRIDGQTGMELLKVTVSNNISFGNGVTQGGAGIYIYNTFGCGVTGNICYNNTYHGIITQYSKDITIIGNVCGYSNRHGIYVGVGSVGNTVTTNVCYYNNQNGIYLVASNNIVVGNICRHNGVVGTYYGIWLENASRNIVCFNQSFDDEATVTQNGGMALLGTSSNNIITHNWFYNNGGYGINIAAAACKENMVRDNEFSGNTSGSINDSGTDSLINDNVGYVTENRGIVVMAAGGIVTVTHKMDSPPVVVHVTPQADIGDVWVPAKSIGTVGFSVQCDSAVAGTSVFWSGWAKSSGMFW